MPGASNYLQSKARSAGRKAERAGNGSRCRFAAISTGAFVLAEAGLLDDRKAITHWMHAPRFQAQYPAVKLDKNRIFS